MAQSNAESVQTYIYRFLGIAGFCIIISLYIQKTWDTAHNFLSNLLPGLEEIDDPSNEVGDFSSDKTTSVATNVGETLNKMFMKLNDDIVDAKCDFGNIISPKGKDTRSVYK